MSGATVCVYAVVGEAKGPLVPVTASPGATGTVANGCYTTGADGNYAVVLPVGTAGDLLVEATGGLFCTNEQPLLNGACQGAGSLVTLGTSAMTSLTTVTPGAASTVFTTPLTTAAVNKSARLKAATFDAEFNTLAGQLVGPEAKLTSRSRPTPQTQPYLGQVATYLQNGGTLGNAVTSLQQGTVPGGSTGGDSTPATVNAALARSYDLKFYAGSGAGCGTLCTFTEGGAVPVTVGADGSLSIAGKTLTNPFYRSYGGTPNLFEVIWLDAAANLEYALTNNISGQFSEINVGNAAHASNGIPAFLGQIRAPQNNSVALLGTKAGTYSLVYQYGGAAVAWDTVTIAADGAITFSPAGPSITAAEIAAVTDWTSALGRIDVAVTRDLNTPPDGVTGDDRISIHLDADGGVRSIAYDAGKGSVLADDTGVRVSDTKVAALVDAGAALPSNAVSGTVNGTALSLAVSNVTNGGNFVQLMAETGGTQPSWFIRISPNAAVTSGTYSCLRTGTVDTFIAVRTAAGGPQYSTQNGGRCTITFTRSGNSVSGTFAAELLDDRQDGTPRVVLDGAFQYTPPAP